MYGIMDTDPIGEDDDPHGGSRFSTGGGEKTRRIKSRFGN